MKEVHNVNAFKNLGQWFLCPIIALWLAVKAVQAGGIYGYFGLIFGALIFLSMWALLLVIYHKLVVEKIMKSNEKIEAEEKAQLRKMIEEENDPDAYPEYDD